MTARRALIQLAAAMGAALWLCTALARQSRGFDAISVRPVRNWNPYHDYSVRRIDPGRFSWPNTTFSDVIMWAWNLNRFQLRHQPEWIFHDHYTIEATVTSLANVMQMQQMMRRYLAAGLGMRFHFASTPEDTYELLVAKGGFKLRPVPAPQGQWRGGDPMSLAEFIHSLEGLGRRLVLDKTGISGYFNIHAALGRNGLMLRKGPDGRPEQTLSDVIEDKLGLKLQPARAHVKVLIVDAIRPPSGN